MSRFAWFVAGAGAGVYATRRVRRAAEVFTPDGLADRLAGASRGLRLFREEVATGAAEKEHDVRERLGLAPHDRADRPALTRVDPTPGTAVGGPATTREGSH